LVCRLKRPEARDFSHVRFTPKRVKNFIAKGTLKKLDK
jgi:hypothetical protein